MYRMCIEEPFNPLLHMLFLDHDIIFFFLDNIEKNQEKLK